MEENYKYKFNKSFLKKPANEFIREFEVELNKLMHDDMEKRIDDVNIIYTPEYEISILEQGYFYNTRTHLTISRWLMRYLDITSVNYDLTKFNYYKNIFEQAFLKQIFLDRKLTDLGQDIKITQHLTNGKELRKKNNLLIGGKKPNISERYKIANETLNLHNTITKKNISATEKHILLAHILGCNQQTARELFNRTHLKRTSVRHEMINEYLKNIK